MITHYVTDVSQWEAWQTEYHFGVLLIFPPEPLLSRVNMLRAVHDPYSHAICAAHISLTVPLPRPMEAAHLHELAQLAGEFEAFPIRYGPLRHYLPAAPGVCLTIEPQETLECLLRRLETATIFAGARPRPYPFSAHMTIAEFISVERTHTLMQELADSAPMGFFPCTGVSYAVPDTQFNFSERAILPLRSPSRSIST